QGAQCDNFHIIVAAGKSSNEAFFCRLADRKYRRLNRGHESLVVQQGIEQRHGRDVLKPPQEGYRCFYSFRVGLRLQEGMESFDPAAVNDLFDMFRLMEFGQTV